jgi:hypothetical protein
MEIEKVDLVGKVSKITSNGIHVIVKLKEAYHGKSLAVLNYQTAGLGFLQCDDHGFLLLGQEVRVKSVSFELDFWHIREVEPA